MYETYTTIVGNVVDNPRLRRTDKGTEVASFRVGSTARRQDRETGQWVDGPKLFVSVSCWRQLASNAADSLRRGDPVIVSGRLYTREYEKDGQKRSSLELEANAVGHDLARGTTEFRRARVEVAPAFDPGRVAEPVLRPELAGVLAGALAGGDGGRPNLRLVPDLEPLAETGS